MPRTGPDSGPRYKFSDIVLLATHALAEPGQALCPPPGGRPELLCKHLPLQAACIADHRRPQHNFEAGDAFIDTDGSKFRDRSDVHQGPPVRQTHISACDVVVIFTSRAVQDSWSHLRECMVGCWCPVHSRFFPMGSWSSVVSPLRNSKHRVC